MHLFWKIRPFHLHWDGLCFALLLVVFAPKAPIFGSPKSHFSVRPFVRPSVRPSAATKIKTVTDETIKTYQKIMNFSGVFEGMVHFQILCQFILESKNDQKIVVSRAE